MNVRIKEELQNMIKEFQEDCSSCCTQDVQDRCSTQGEQIAIEQAETACIYTRQEIINYILEPLLIFVEKEN